MKFKEKSADKLVKRENVIINGIPYHISTLIDRPKTVIVDGYNLLDGKGCKISLKKDQEMKTFPDPKVKDYKLLDIIEKKSVKKAKNYNSDPEKFLYVYVYKNNKNKIRHLTIYEAKTLIKATKKHLLEGNSFVKVKKVPIIEKEKVKLVKVYEDVITIMLHKK